MGIYARTGMLGAALAFFAFAGAPALSAQQPQGQQDTSSMTRTRDTTRLRQDTSATTRRRDTMRLHQDTATARQNPKDTIRKNEPR
jgi:hypothetical protein